MHNITSSPRGSVGVGGNIVVVELGWCTVEISRVAEVVVISSGPWFSTVGIGRMVHRGSVGSRGKSWRWVVAILWGMMGSWLMHHAALAVLIGFDLSFHLDGRVDEVLNISKGDIDQHRLHLIVQTIQESFILHGFSVDLIWGIPS